MTGDLDRIRENEGRLLTQDEIALIRWHISRGTHAPSDAVRLLAHLDRVEARLAAADDALERISAQQPATLAMIERNGFVFDSIGREPGNWQHLAFSIYVDLCQVDALARIALDMNLPSA